MDSNIFYESENKSKNILNLKNDKKSREKRKEDHFKKEDCELKNIVRWVVPTAQKCMMEPVCLVLEPGGSTQKDLPHEGEEFGYVIKGKVNVHYGNRSFVAGKGESFYYTSEKTHYLSSDSGAIMLWVSAPPSF